MLRSSRTIVLDEQLGLAAHRQAQVVVELGELLAIGRQRLERAELQPLPGEVLAQRPRLRVAEHPPDLRREHCGSRSVPRVGRAQQLGVGHAAHRKYDSREASSCWRDPVAPAPAACRGRSRSMRKRKSGDTRIACMPTARPSSNDRSSFCARLGERDVLSTSASSPDGGRRAAPGGHDRRHARARCAVEMAAGVDLRQARPRRARRYDTGRRFDRRYAQPFSGIFASSVCRVVEPLAHCAIRSGGALAGGLNSARRLGQRRRLRSLEPRGQAFVDARDGHRDQCSPAVSDLHLNGLAAEVLPIVANGAGPPDRASPGTCFRRPTARSAIGIGSLRAAPAEARRG